MIKKTTMTIAAAVLALGAMNSAALADGCSGRDHTGGTIAGAIVGGVIGGAVSHGNGGAVVGGALLGGLAGNAISRDIDCEDRDYAERSYRDSFDGRVGEHYEWRHDGRHGYIVTTREYRRHGRLCRDFEQVTYRHGREVVREGTACRRHGEWEII
ncbi:MAG TPA: glycine zipper domain-containing protein [Rhizomicrobium sp.]|jgi:surface antigen|nr:glycine zipper domain-containing protein [Rhizomicrobium sp.]